MAKPPAAKTKAPAASKAKKTKQAAEQPSAKPAVATEETEAYIESFVQAAGPLSSTRIDSKPPSVAGSKADLHGQPDPEPAALTASAVVKNELTQVQTKRNLRRKRDDSVAQPLPPSQEEAVSGAAAAVASKEDDGDKEGGAKSAAPKTKGKKAGSSSKDRYKSVCYKLSNLNAGSVFYKE